MSSPSIQLYGSPISTYYNKVKIALLEFGCSFAEVSYAPGEDHWPQGGSPTAKVPFLHWDGQGVYESQTIIEFLEDQRGADTPTLFPVDPLERARCRELIQYIEQYLDASARVLYPSVFWGKPMPDDAIETAKSGLLRGMRALSRRADFSTWLCGPSFTHADAAAWVHLSTINWALARAGVKGLLLECEPALEAYLARLAERPSIRQTEQARREAAERMRAARQASAS